MTERRPETTPDVEDLEKLLSSLEADLEDLQEERMFVLGQTGVHLSASTVRRYDEQLAALTARIDEVRRELAARRAAAGE
jgi:hypothetical protein